MAVTCLDGLMFDTFVRQYSASYFETKRLGVAEAQQWRCLEIYTRAHKYLIAGRHDGAHSSQSSSCVKSSNFCLCNIPAGVAVLSVLLLQASAQLLSCSDINCPMSYGAAKCEIDNTTLTEIGVANFSSSLSPDPLTWTIGYVPDAFTKSTDQRRYYLGTPQGLNLNTRADITGCALFFTGIEAGLSFVEPNGTILDLGTISGTCADALGDACESDLTNQVHNLAANLTASGNLQCSDMVQALQFSPPESCTKAGTWGNITAKSEFFHWLMQRVV